MTNYDPTPDQIPPSALPPVDMTYASRQAMMDKAIAERQLIRDWQLPQQKMLMKIW